MGCTGQRRVLSSRGNQDGRVLVGVLPESEELLVLARLAPHVTSVCLSPGKLEMRERGEKDHPGCERMFLFRPQRFVPGLQVDELGPVARGAHRRLVGWGAGRLQCGDCVKSFFLFAWQLQREAGGAYTYLISVPGFCGTEYCAREGVRLRKYLPGLSRGGRSLDCSYPRL